MNPPDVQSADPERTAAGGDGLREIRAVAATLVWGRYLILSTLIVGGALTLVVVGSLPGRYQSDATVLVQPVGDLAAPSSATAPTSPEIVRSQLEVVRSPGVVGRVVERLRLIGDPEFASRRARREPDPEVRRAMVLENVQDHLKVDNDGRSVTIHIGFAARSPQKAQRIADEIANEYIRTASDLKNRAADLTRTRLEKRLADLRLATVDAEDAAERYRRSKALVWLPAAGDADERTGGATYTSRLLDQFSRQAAEISAAAEQAQARARVASGDMARTGGANTPEVLSSAVIGSFLQQDAALAATEASLAARYTSDYPALRQVRAQRAKLRGGLRTTRDNILRSLNLQAHSAEVANQAAGARAQALEGRVSQQTADTLRYQQLRSDAATKRKIYEDFASRAGAISERSLLQLPDAVLVSPASLPIRESSPNRPILLAIGFMLALMAGCAVALLAGLRVGRTSRGGRHRGVRQRS